MVPEQVTVTEFFFLSDASILLLNTVEPGADLEGACGACALPPKIRKAYVIQR